MENVDQCQTAKLLCLCLFPVMQTAGKEHKVSVSTGEFIILIFLPNNDVVESESLTANKTDGE